MTRHKPHVALDCYVRASAALDPVDDFLETIHEYVDMGLVDEFSIDVWPNRARLRDGGVGSAAVIDDYERFQAWADNDGVSLEPAFEHRIQATGSGDDQDAFLLLPVVCLAVRIDGDLVIVAPHSTDTTVYSVGDALSDMRSLLDRDEHRDRTLDDLPSDHAVRAAVEGDGEGSGTDPDERPVTER